MMEINYYCAVSMYDLDSNTVKKIAETLYGKDVKIFLGMQKKQVTLENLAEIDLKGQQVTLQNGVHLEAGKPDYVTLLQPTGDSVIDPKYKLKIAAEGEIAVQTRELIENILMK
ncbi:hypothetical protein HZA33_03780 [Candidatus Pacearchaeota archaeon]|nr:hypothetical protein [Candidatus Pacearchaeota archaeon]